MFMMLAQALCLITIVLAVVGAILYVTSPRWRNFLYELVEDAKRLSREFDEKFQDQEGDNNE